jgi:hypothetical protein
MVMLIIGLALTPSIAVAVLVIECCVHSHFKRRKIERAAARAVEPDEPTWAAVRDAVRRAELRRRGVTPLEPRDPQREELEDQLLAFVDGAHDERLASSVLYPTFGRNVIALPTKTDGGAVWAARRHDPQGEAS